MSSFGSYSRNYDTHGYLADRSRPTNSLISNVRNGHPEPRSYSPSVKSFVSKEPYSPHKYTTISSTVYKSPRAQESFQRESLLLNDRSNRVLSNDAIRYSSLPPSVKSFVSKEPYSPHKYTTISSTVYKSPRAQESFQRESLLLNDRSNRVLSNDAIRYSSLPRSSLNGSSNHNTGDRYNDHNTSSDWYTSHNTSSDRYTGQNTSSGGRGSFYSGYTEIRETPTSSWRDNFTDRELNGWNISSPVTTERVVNRNDLKKEKGFIGLSNMGNTCFMNSVIQCLSNTPNLADYIENYADRINPESDMKGDLVHEFTNVLRNLWHSLQPYFSPVKFKTQVQKFAFRFAGYEQHDAQEFLVYLLEGLHQEINIARKIPLSKRISAKELDAVPTGDKADFCWKLYKSTDNSQLVDMFVGQLKSTLQCQKCQLVSTTFDPFWDLSLPIPSETESGCSLENCFQLFTHSEVLDGAESPTCEKCRTKQACKKTLSIERFPNILVLHLKRFSGDKFRSKLKTMVRFPLIDLELTDFASDKESSSGEIYKLYAVVNHIGSVTGGHYTAACFNHTSKRWALYNDTEVNIISSTEVMSREGYILFYERCPTSTKTGDRLLRTDKIF